MICLVRNTPKKSGLHFLAFISHPGNNQINNQMTYICNMSVFMLSTVLVILPAVLLADWIGWLSSPFCPACCLCISDPLGLAARQSCLSLRFPCCCLLILYLLILSALLSFDSILLVSTFIAGLCFRALPLVSNLPIFDEMV